MDQITIVYTLNIYNFMSNFTLVKLGGWCMEDEANFHFIRRVVNWTKLGGEQKKTDGGKLCPKENAKRLHIGATSI